MLVEQSELQLAPSQHRLCTLQQIGELRSAARGGSLQLAAQGPCAEAGVGALGRLTRVEDDAAGGLGGAVSPRSCKRPRAFASA